MKLQLEGMLVACIPATRLEDVDGWLVDGAHNGAAGVDRVAHRAHHDRGRARVQPRGRLVLHAHPSLLSPPVFHRHP